MGELLAGVCKLESGGTVAWVTIRVRTGSEVPAVSRDLNETTPGAVKGTGRVFPATLSTGAAEDDGDEPADTESMNTACRRSTKSRPNTLQPIDKRRSNPLVIPPGGCRAAASAEHIERCYSKGICEN
eukprot:INCI16498.1.p2 GENE.INCI16498.1~~INCI16498.1.p2  ORF type:complete len:128 (-),score=21.35 INCI16498.1:186-569(-)